MVWKIETQKIRRIEIKTMGRYSKQALRSKQSKNGKEEEEEENYTLKKYSMKIAKKRTKTVVSILFGWSRKPTTTTKFMLGLFGVCVSIWKQTFQHLQLRL